MQVDFNNIRQLISELKLHLEANKDRRRIMDEVVSCPDYKSFLATVSKYLERAKAGN